MTPEQTAMRDRLLASRPSSRPLGYDQLVNPDGPDAWAMIERQAAELETTKAALADPAAVIVNMMRGTIAVPALASFGRVCPEVDELQATIERQAAETARYQDGFTRIRNITTCPTYPGNNLRDIRFIVFAALALEDTNG
ncbi:MAG: hypothetical protein ACK4ZW_06030 [Blastomonas sp.]